MPLGDKIRELDEQVAAVVRRAVDDLRGEVRRRLDEATSELQRRLGEVAPELPESFVNEDYLRRIAEEAAAPTSEALDRAGAEARSGASAALRTALAGIDAARSQADVLQALLDASGRYARRAAVLLLRQGRLAGWGAHGFETDAEAARAVSLDAGEPPWSVLVEGGGPRSVAGAGCAPLVSQLDSPLPREGYLVPLILRDRVAALLYVDRPSEDDRVDLSALQVLTYAAALALETLAFRERETTATLLPAEGVEGVEEAPAEEPVEIEIAGEEAAQEVPAGFEAEALPEVEPTEVAPAVSEEPAGPDADEVAVAGAPVAEEEPVDFEPEAAGFQQEAPAVESEPEAYELPEETTFESGFEMEEVELETDFETDLEADVEPAVEGPEVEVAGEEPEASSTPPHGDELLTRRYDYLRAVEEAEEEAAPAATEAVDESALEETAFEEAPELEDQESTRVEEPESVTPWQAEEPAGAAEVEEEVEERPEAGAVPPPPAPASGGPVEPPADVEGPGWAFSAASEPVSVDDEAAHEEARRLARLLVSEIQLYNQDEVDEGRRNRDIYERLKDDIDRSRQLYEERVDPGVRETTDYFYQELVRQLGAGDAKSLGI